MPQQDTVVKVKFTTTYRARGGGDEKMNPDSLSESGLLLVQTKRGDY
jgi:hypothetical protein